MADKESNWSNQELTDLLTKLEAWLKEDHAQRELQKASVEAAEYAKKLREARNIDPEALKMTVGV